MAPDDPPHLLEHGRAVMFSAWCHIAAAVAWDLGWRPIRDRGNPSPFASMPYGEPEQLVDLVFFFAAGQELSTDVGRFRMRRIVADAQRLMKKYGAEA